MNGTILSSNSFSIDLLCLISVLSREEWCHLHKDCCFWKHCSKSPYFEASSCLAKLEENNDQQQQQKQIKKYIKAKQNKAKSNTKQNKAKTKAKLFQSQKSIEHFGSENILHSFVNLSLLLKALQFFVDFRSYLRFLLEVTMQKGHKKEKVAKKSQSPM